MSKELKRCPFCGGSAAFHIYSFYGENRIQVSCNNCKARTMAINENPDFSAKDRAAELWNKREPSDEWIPITDKLPGTQRPVLVHIQYPEDEFEIHVAYFDGEAWKDFYMDDDDILAQVVAWMELPKHYTGCLK